MAIKKVWIGGQLYQFDDRDTYPSGDGGDNYHGVKSEAQLLVETAPTHDNHVVRLKDLEPYQHVRLLQVNDLSDPIELGDHAGTVDGDLLLAYQDAINADSTLYVWHSGIIPANSPYVVPGSKGSWVARAGAYINGSTTYAGNLAVTGSANMGSTFDVAGPANMASTLNVNGPVNLDSMLDVTGPVTMNSTLAVTGKITGAATPSADNDVIRINELNQRVRLLQVADLSNPIELGNYAGTANGDLLLAYQDAASADTTLYVWHSGTISANPPYVVAGSSGSWVARAGAYVNGSVTYAGNIAMDGTLTLTGEINGFVTTVTFSKALIADISNGGEAIEVGGVPTSSTTGVAVPGDGSLVGVTICYDTSSGMTNGGLHIYVGNSHFVSIALSEIAGTGIVDRMWTVRDSIKFEEGDLIYGEISGDAGDISNVIVTVYLYIDGPSNPNI